MRRFVIERELASIGNADDNAMQQAAHTSCGALVGEEPGRGAVGFP